MVEVLLSIVCKDPAQLNSASTTENAIWGRLAAIFNSTEYRATLIDTIVEHCSSNGIDPNDLSCRAFVRTSKWIEKYWLTSMSSYIVSFKLWKKGTGGGPSEDQLFAGRWNDQRADVEYQNYDPKRRAWLAGMYLFDKTNSFVFLQRQARVPDEVGEAGMSGEEAMLE